jgi:nudix-type nucleoside diphosphatase (YffH/AdpP family)
MKADLISKKRIYDGFFKLDEVSVCFEKFSGGMSEPVTRLIFERRDAVAAVIWNRDARKLVFVNQFRAPAFEKGPAWLTEVIAGMVGQGEDECDALIREIREETGYEVEREAFTRIATFYTSPGGSSERISLYFAEVSNASRVGPGGGVAAEQEDIRVTEMSAKEARQALAEFHIQDAKTLVGLYWFFEEFPELG